MPHAALLIDFDNVTLGIRSDLTKELKTLLNSDIIRGKVAVQRAYADWRRYPQYIVPLSERSIDLIFATAVGSTKKNATDIRLAIDAMELVFTRPEIGTFILLSGDSDFSSLVIKLKEYGKYVVGVGIRESASDLLIQNCDEYYSYSELAGLQKEDEAPSAQRDPWELAREAVEQMARQGDVMRSDRLKQVMQQIDPNFDERNAGFNRFSKFVLEAGNRGLLRLSKLDNGQYEVAPEATAPAAAPPPAEAKRESENGRRGRRGRRDRGRDGRRGPEASPEPKPAPAPEPKPASKADPKAKPASSGRGRGSERRDSLTLGAVFGLMTRALEELAKPVGQEALRARMAALHGREDSLLEQGRFVRLLRQANDAEIAEVSKLGDDDYEISLPKVGRARMAERVAAESTAEPKSPPTPSVEVDASPEPSTDAAQRPPALRFRRGSRGAVTPREVSLVGAVTVDDEAGPPPAPEVETKPKRKGARGRPVKKSPPSEAQPKAPVEGSTAPDGPPPTTSAEPSTEAPAAAPRRSRPRRRNKSSKAPGGQGKAAENAGAD